MLNVGSIISGAFALPTRFPLAVGAWCLVNTLIAAISWYLVPPALPTPLEVEGTAAPDPLQGVGWILLTQLASLVIAVLIATAAYRLILRPQQPGLAGVRLGMDELRSSGLTLMLMIGYGMVVVIAALVIALLASALGPDLSEAGLLWIVGPVILVMLAIFAWLQVRLSLVFALTFVRRRIMIGEAWELTSGRFWVLFGGYLVVLLLLLLLWVAAGAMSALPWINASMATGLDPGAMQASANRISDINALTVIAWLLEGLSATLTIALFGGATATVI